MRSESPANLSREVRNASPDSEIITDTEVTPGNAGDASVAEDLIDDLINNRDDAATDDIADDTAADDTEDRTTASEPKRGGGGG